MTTYDVFVLLKRRPYKRAPLIVSPRFVCTARSVHDAVIVASGIQRVFERPTWIADYNAKAVLERAR